MEKKDFEPTQYSSTMAFMGTKDEDTMQCIKAPIIPRTIPNGEKSPAIPMRQRTAKTIPITKEAWTLFLQQQGILENLQKQNRIVNLYRIVNINKFK